MLIEPFKDGDGLGIVMGVIFWLLGLLLLGLVIWGIFYLADSSFLPVQQAEGRVTRKYIVPAHDDTHFQWIGKVPMTTTTHYEAEYRAVVKVDGKYDEISLSDTCFRLIDSGQRVNCWYVIGRFSGDIYLKRIQTL